MELLRRHDVALEGAEAVVVGRSDLVGKPIAALLLAANATVTVVPLAHARPGRRCAAAPTCWSPPSAAPGWSRATGSSEGAVVIDVGHRTAPTPGWSATSSSSPRASARA